MDVRTETADSTTTIRLSGEANILYAAATKTALLAALDDCTPGASLGIDLAEVVEIDSAGLQLLILTQREAIARGLWLQFLQPSQAVTELVEAANLNDTLFPVIEPPAQ